MSLPTMPNTLDALVSTLAAAMTTAGSACTVVSSDDDSIGFPAQPPFPKLIVSPLHDDVERRSGTLRMNKEHQPNLYSVIYVANPVGQQGPGVDRHAVIRQMWADVEIVKNAFAQQPARLLTDGQGKQWSLGAGDKITFSYDPQGPYITYLGRNHIGCFGRLTNWELPRHG